MIRYLLGLLDPVTLADEIVGTVRAFWSQLLCATQDVTTYGLPVIGEHAGWWARCAIFAII
jgi:hypothetical protein